MMNSLYKEVKRIQEVSPDDEFFPIVENMARISGKSRAVLMLCKDRHLENLC